MVVVFVVTTFVIVAGVVVSFVGQFGGGGFSGREIFFSSFSGGQSLAFQILWAGLDCRGRALRAGRRLCCASSRIRQRQGVGNRGQVAWRGKV